MTSPRPSLLYIDMAHTAETVRRTKHQAFFEARHSAGYFARVWGVHPLADAGGKQCGRIEFIRFSPRQFIVEGVSQTLRLPKFLLPLNFLISQAALLRVLRRLVRRHDIALIGASDAVYAGLVAWCVKKLCRKPLVIRVYSNGDELYEATGALAMPRLFPFRWLEKRVVRFVLSHADLVIGANRNYLDWAIANGASQQTAVVPNAKYVEKRHFVEPSDRGSPAQLFERLKIPFRRPTMLYLGRLLPLKLPDDAIRAMAAVISRRPDAVGVLVGAGPMRLELEALIDRLGMNGRIHLVGHLDQEEVSRLTPHCITLSPLTGLALIECGLAGSPIVAYDRDWQAEFVEDGVSGFVVPFRDHAGMAERALELIDDPAKAAGFAAAIRARALHFADHDRIAALEASVFDRLLRRQTAALASRATPSEALSRGHG